MLPALITGIAASSLAAAALDAAVGYVAGQAKKYVDDELASRLKKLRTEGDFNRKFQKGLQKAVERFIKEYEAEDEDLAAVLAADSSLFENAEVQKALVDILKNPGAYLDKQIEVVTHSFATVLPGRKNRERVDRAVKFLLQCLVEELWRLPELQPAYVFQFQRITAEAAQQQVTLQKAQLQALANLDAGLRQAMLQLTDAIGERKQLPAPPEKTRVCQNLPHRNYGAFVGRETELEQVTQILKPYPQSQYPLVTIDGVGGIGKSTLALEVAHRYVDNYATLPPEERFEAVVWASAKRTVLQAEGIAKRHQALRTLEDIYLALAITLQREDITRARPEEQPEIVRQALTRQRTLLIVDNLETVDDERVREFLHELPAPTKAIVTTRYRIDVAYPVRLKDLPWDEAQRVMVQACAQKDVTLAEADQRRLYERVGGVPLALEWSIAQMGRGYGVETVLQRLGEATSDVAQFCFQAALDRIHGKPPHTLLMALSLFATDASRGALGYIADLPELDRDDGLVELEALSLVNRRADRFSFLPLAKIFALAELAKRPKVEKRLTRRWVDYFKTMWRNNIGATETDYYWRYGHHYGFLQEGQNLLEAIRWVDAHGANDDLFILTVAASEYMDTLGLWNDMSALTYRALERARAVQNPNAIARFALIKAWLSEQRGDYKEAQSLSEEALAAAPNDESRCLILQRRSGVYRKLDDFATSQKLCEEALGLAAKLHSGDLLALVQTEYGKLERDRGQWEQAWFYFSAVLDWFEKRAEQTPRDEQLAVGTWGHQAIVAYHLGRYQEAKDLCLKSLEFFEAYGTKGYLATLKYRLALAEAKLGEFYPALAHIHEAMDWYERLGMKPDYAKAGTLLKELEDNLAQTVTGE